MQSMAGYRMLDCVRCKHATLVYDHLFWFRFDAEEEGILRLMPKQTSSILVCVENMLGKEKERARGCAKC